MSIIDRMLGRKYEAQEGTRRETCPHPSYKEAWVDVPGEWTLGHQAKYQETFEAIEPEHGSFMGELAGALVLVDDFNIPGLKKDLSNLSETPTTILGWLRDVVIADYLLSWQHDPKALERLSTMSKEIQQQSLSGSSEDLSIELTESSSEEEEA